MKLWKIISQLIITFLSLRNIESHIVSNVELVKPYEISRKWREAECNRPWVSDDAANDVRFCFSNFLNHENQPEMSIFNNRDEVPFFDPEQRGVTRVHKHYSYVDFSFSVKFST